MQVAARQALQRIFRASSGNVEAVSPAGVSRELKRIATEHFRMQFVWPLGEDKLVEVWDLDRLRHELDALGLGW